VVWGRQDPVFPLEIGERLAKALGAPLRVLEKARHAPNLEHPEEFNRILRGFLSEG
jgi:pimeloyl-ACP methyl ester carboxylesterase